ncbi:hypothetical protein, partial [Vibrio sp. F13]
MRTIFEQAVNWKQPTVKEVELVMIKAASKLGCDVINLHKNFGVDARTFRRWKENAIDNPDQISSIKYSAFGLLVAIATCNIVDKDGHRIAIG